VHATSRHFTLLLLFPKVIQAGIIKWNGKSISVSISTERLTRIEFPEKLRSVFISRSDIAVEREERSLYVRALAPEIENTLFVGCMQGSAPVYLTAQSRKRIAFNRDNIIIETVTA